MKQQAKIQPQKENTALPINKLLQHTAVRTDSIHANLSNPLPKMHFGYDFSQVAVRPSVPIVGQNYGTAACPMFPRTCPFGGACHKCPTQISSNAKPSSDQRGGLGQ